MLLTRRWSMFLLGAGVFNWLVWPRFSAAIWKDPRAWQGEIGHSSPTGFLIVHAVLIVAALGIGSVVGALGLRGLLAARRPLAKV